MIDGIWARSYIGERPSSDPNIYFVETRRIFLSALNFSIECGRLKIAKNGVFLEGSADELTALFDRTMPKTIEELIPYSYKDSPDPAIRDNPPDMSKLSDREIIQQIDLAVYLWFFNDDCPGGAVWVLDDGSLCWT